MNTTNYETGVSSSFIEFYFTISKQEQNAEKTLYETMQ